MTMIRSRQPHINKLSRRNDLFFEVDRLRKLNKKYSEKISKNEEAQEVYSMCMDSANRDLKDKEETIDAQNDLIRELEEKTIQSDETVEELLNDAASTIEQLRIKNYRLTSLNEKLERDKELLMEKVDFDVSLSAMTEFVLGMQRMPRTMTEIVEMAKRVFSDMIEFSDNPINKSKSYTRDQIDDTWFIVKSLPLLWDLVFNDDQTDFVADFKNATGLRFSIGETSYFKKDQDKVKKRTFTFGGKHVVCMWHIGRMSHDYNTAIRCYFYPDSSMKKLRIGFLGEHL